MEERDKNSEPGDDVGVRTHWVEVGQAASRTIAEFAVNGLKSYEIPAVLDARPGVLGSAGLPMRSWSTGDLEAFRILVPQEYEEEAVEIIKTFLGGGEATAEAELPEDE